MPLALQALLAPLVLLAAAAMVRMRPRNPANGWIAFGATAVAAGIALVELLRLAPGEHVDVPYLTTFPYADLAIRMDGLSLAFAAVTLTTAALLMLARQRVRGDRREPWLGWLLTSAAAGAVIMADNLLLVYVALQVLTLAWSGALDEAAPRRGGTSGGRAGGRRALAADRGAAAAVAAGVAGVHRAGALDWRRPAVHGRRHLALADVDPAHRPPQPARAARVRCPCAVAAATGHDPGERRLRGHLARRPRARCPRARYRHCSPGAGSGLRAGRDPVRHDRREIHPDGRGNRMGRGAVADRRRPDHRHESAGAAGGRNGARGARWDGRRQPLVDADRRRRVAGAAGVDRARGCAGRGALAVRRPVAVAAAASCRPAGSAAVEAPRPVARAARLEPPVALGRLPGGGRHGSGPTVIVYLPAVLFAVGLLVVYGSAGRRRQAGTFAMAVAAAWSLALLVDPSATAWAIGPLAAILLLSRPAQRVPSSFEGLTRRGVTIAASMLVALFLASRLPIGENPVLLSAVPWLLSAVGVAWLVRPADQSERLPGPGLMVAGAAGVILCAVNAGPLTAGVAGALALMPIAGERARVPGRLRPAISGLLLLLAAVAIALAATAPSFARVTLFDLSLNLTGPVLLAIAVVLVAGVVVTPLGSEWVALLGVLALTATAPSLRWAALAALVAVATVLERHGERPAWIAARSEEHTSELQSPDQ